VVLPLVCSAEFEGLMVWSGISNESTFDPDDKCIAHYVYRVEYCIGSDLNLWKLVTE
jgi:hypothetical protein